MKKISYLMIFAGLLFLANISKAQENSTTNQASKNVNAFFKNVKGEQVTVKDLIESELLTDINGYTVVSFDLTLNVKTIGNADLVTSSNTGNKISERQAALLRKQNPGDKVYIENIKCKDPQGNECVLSALKFVIK